MYILGGVGLALGTLLLCCMFVPTSRADEWNKKTFVTFSEAVEIPGQILPAGTYVFELMDSPSNRHIVQIWNAGHDDLLATIFTIPSEQMEPADDSIFEFDERPSNSPMALHYWFYPGDLVGQSLLIPTARTAARQTMS